MIILNKTNLKVKIVNLIILIIGIASICFFTENSKRPILVLMLGAIIMIIQPVILKFIRKDTENAS